MQAIALVTGGSGFIGSELIRALNQKGVKVRALLRKTSPRGNLKGVEFEETLGDLSDEASLRKAVKGVDYIFHIAGVISAKSREDFFKFNSEGTGVLARVCAEENPGLKRFIYVSSLAASGPATSLNPRTEMESESPVSVYGESKLGGEVALKKYANFPFSIVRPPAVYGPRDKGIFEFIKLINSGVMPVFKGHNESGKKYYSVVHVEDLVNGILEAGFSPKLSRQETFFICGDGVFSWQDIMGQIAAELGKKPLRLPLPDSAWKGLACVYAGLSKLTKKQYPLTADKLKELKQDYWICSNELAKTRMGYSPKHSMQVGLKQTIRWYRENGWIK